MPRPAFQLAGVTGAVERHIIDSTTAVAGGGEQQLLVAAGTACMDKQQVLNAD